MNIAALLKGCNVGVAGLLAGLAAAGMINPLPAQAESVPRLRQVAVPLFAKGQAQPIAVLRMGALRGGHQRRGFFRIGVLPAVIAEDVELEVLNADAISEVLTELWQRLPRKRPEIPVEIRRFSIRLAGESNPRLSAAEAVYATSRCVQLSGCVVPELGRVPLPRARLMAAPADQPRLILFLPDGRALTKLFDARPQTPQTP